MLSLASLLNPAPPGAQPPTPQYRPSPALSSPASSFSSECHSLFFDSHIASSRHAKMTKDSGGFVKSKPKGTVNFPPFESLDEHSLQETKRYQIYPRGKIQEYCRHIPYNSGKKDFYEKTGRESFEVFQYVFKVPGDESEYTVMWDYNVGLVRMTPFFKCCKYSKTQPAKMLNLNPGLRDITHSITGGSIAAQGYWMPFACAKAVCATFCAPIAGALIPIFGPNFPSQCARPDAPEHGRMQIDQVIIMDSVREAAMFRRIYANAASVGANNHLPPHRQHHHHHHHHQQQQQQPQQQQQQRQQHQHTHSQMHHYSHGPALPSPTSMPSPRLGRRALPRWGGSPHDYDRERLGYEGRLRFKRGPGSPYMPDSEPDTRLGPELHHALAGHALGRGGMIYSPLSPPRSSGNGGGWTVANHTRPPNPRHVHAQSTPAGAYHHSSACREAHEMPLPSASDPILSAIPRFGHGTQRLEHQLHQPSQHHLHPQSHMPSRLPPIPDSSVWNAPRTIVNSKRPAADVVEVVVEYDEYSDKSSPATTATTSTSVSREDCVPEPAVTWGTDKNAALLLMNLSVRDPKDVRESREEEREGGRRFHGARGCGPESMSMSPVPGSDKQDGHRSKRRRATSM